MLNGAQAATSLPMLSPIVDEIANERGDIKVGKVNVDEQPELANNFGVMGYYCAKAVTMAKHRARIDRDPKPLKKLQKLLDGQSEFVLEGPTYARAKPCAEKTLTEWYNKKNFSIYHEEKLTEEIYSPVLEERLLAGYRFLIPFYRYFMTLDSDADPREA